MMKTTSKSTSTGTAAQDRAETAYTDENRWSVLFENILAGAVKKSETVANPTHEDDAAFDHAARILRMLMGSAEIVHRIRRTELKDQPSHDEPSRISAPTEEELDEAYRRIAAKVDAAYGTDETDGEEE